MLDILFQKLKPIVPEKWHWVLEHGGFKRYFANTGWMFFGQFFSMIVAFFIGAYIARYLGPKNYGAMSYTISFVSLFGFLAGFGVDNILNRELVKYPEKKDELLGNSFWLKLIGGIIAIIVINFVSFFTNEDTLTRLLVFVFSLTFVFQSFTVISIFFQSQVLSKKIVSVQLIITFLSTLVKLLFVYLHLGVFWIITVYLFDSINLAIGLTLLYNKNYKKYFNWSINFNLIKLLLKDSIPLMFTTITVVIYSKIDQVILRHMMDEVAVGIYSVAVKLSEIWYFIPSIICASLFPAIINAKKVDNMLFENRLKKMYLIILWLAIVIAVLNFALSSFIIKILFGYQYSFSAVVFNIYIWSIVPSFLMIIINYYLVVENYTKIYFIITLIGAVLNILLNLLFIPKFGIIGAAWATVISYSLVPLSLLFFKKTRKQIYLICNSLVFNIK